jgi:hypothetical protein
LSYQLFSRNIKQKLKNARETAKEELALGHGAENYEFRVGIIRGYDEASAFVDEVLKMFAEGDIQEQ